MSNQPLYLGIDVGTGSARAGVFTAGGQLLGSASQAIQMWKPRTDFVEQSSDDIWSACCTATRQALEKAGVSGDSVAGIGFDATCSLVVLDENDGPVTVSPTGQSAQNVIVWMDHRATDQAQQINQTGHEVLKYVGGVISPEMETPKLLWLRENLPETWSKAACFFDLPDFLTWRATGDDTRSLCSTGCKWTYLGEKGMDGAGWEEDFFHAAGLEDLVRDDFRRIGRRVRPMGEPVGGGLTAKAAGELGLTPGTPVGVSIIDAHAGGIGMIGASFEGEVDFDRRLALIGGTSSCHMAVSKEARFLAGVWGPYQSAMVPGYWLNEGGQSATGALIDHIVFHHHCSAELEDAAKEADLSPYEWLNRRVAELAADLPFPAALAEDLHVHPDFHGNRSPRADPSLRGMISGLTLSSGLDDLARLYLATIDAIAHGTRHIVEVMNRGGYRIDTIFACGGGTKNPLFLQEHADITGCRIILPSEPEAVLLGAAILGAVAAQEGAAISEVMQRMSRVGQVIEPDPATAGFHARKHRVFHALHAAQMEMRGIMTENKKL